MYLPWMHSVLSFWASRTPCQELALKDLSESLPTSVTRPTFHVFEQPEDVELELLPPPPQAKPTTTTATSAAIRPKPLIRCLPGLDLPAARSLNACVGVSLSPVRPYREP